MWSALALSTPAMLVAAASAPKITAEHRIQRRAVIIPSLGWGQKSQRHQAKLHREGQFEAYQYSNRTAPVTRARDAFRRLCGRTAEPPSCPLDSRRWA